MRSADFPPAPIIPTWEEFNAGGAMFYRGLDGRMYKAEKVSVAGKRYGVRDHYLVITSDQGAVVDRRLWHQDGNDGRQWFDQITAHVALHP